MGAGGEPEGCCSAPALCPHSPLRGSLPVSPSVTPIPPSGSLPVFPSSPHPPLVFLCPLMSPHVPCPHSRARPRCSPGTRVVPRAPAPAAAPSCDTLTPNPSSPPLGTQGAGDQSSPTTDPPPWTRPHDPGSAPQASPASSPQSPPPSPWCPPVQSLSPFPPHPHSDPPIFSVPPCPHVSLMSPHHGTRARSQRNPEPSHWSGSRA